MKKGLNSGLVLLVAILCWSPPADAASTLIDFDNLGDGTEITDQYLDQGALFSSNGSLEILRSDGAVSPPNVLLPTFTDSEQSTCRIDFTVPVNNISLWVVDVGDGSVFVSVFGTADDHLQTVVVENPGDGFGVGNQDYVAFSANNVKFLTLFHGPDRFLTDGFTIDNLVYTPVPLPNALLLLVSGLFALFGAKRKLSS